MSRTTNSGSKKAILLRNLRQDDVVFGTKGNGRNEVFLQLLEDNAALYVKCSKFEKMGLIQRLIRDWKGNFYFLNPKTAELALARGNNNSNKANAIVSEDITGEHGADSSIPSTSSKLYTSVRRMMNYVVAKNNYQNVQPQTQKRGVSPSSVMSSITSTAAAPKSKKRKALPSDTSSETSKRSKKKLKKSPKPKKRATSVAKKDVTADSIVRSDTLSPVPMASSTAATKHRIPMLVTPEPSPRIFQQMLSCEDDSVAGDKAQRLSLKHAFARNDSSNGIELPKTFVPSPLQPLPHHVSLLRPMTSTPRMTAARSTRHVSVNAFPPIDHNYVHRLEDSAVRALLSLSTASWTVGNEEECGLFF